MPASANPYGFQVAYAKDSQFSAGMQTHYINSGYSAPINTTNTLASAPGIGSGDPVIFQYTNIGGTGFATNPSLSSGTIGLLQNPWGTTGANRTLANLAVGAVYVNMPPIVGIFDGCSFTPPTTGSQTKKSNSWLNGNPTSGALPATASILDNPNIVYKVQTNSRFAANLISANRTPIGLNYGFTYGVGMNTSTGQSQAALYTGPYDGLLNATGYDSTVLGNAGQTANIFGSFKIIGLVNEPNNSWSDNFVNVYVTINNHYLKPGTTSFLPVTNS